MTISASIMITPNGKTPRTTCSIGVFETLLMTNRLISDRRRDRRDFDVQRQNDPEMDQINIKMTDRGQQQRRNDRQQCDPIEKAPEHQQHQIDDQQELPRV